MTTPFVVGGQSAFVFTPAAPKGQPYSQRVLFGSARGPLAIPWTLTLAAWQAPSPLQRNLTGLPEGTKARITLGGGGENGGSSAQDIVEIDYPAQGVVATVHATMVSVELFGVMAAVGTSDVPPIMQGWLGKGTAHGFARYQTWTTPTRDLVGGGGTQENVPARARAFRVLTTQGAENAIDLQSLQLNGQATPLTQSTDLVRSVGSSDGWQVPQSRESWFPIAPQTQAITFSLAVGPGASVKFQFLIEL